MGDKKVGAGPANSSTSLRTQEGRPIACAFVTKADVEAVLGGNMAGPKTDSGDAGECKYTSPTKEVYVSVHNNDTAVEPDYFVLAKQSAGITKEILGKSDTVTGVGDEAFWGSGGLHVVKGHLYLYIYVTGLGNESREIAKTLALKALQRT